MGGIKFNSLIKDHNHFLQDNYSDEELAKYNDMFLIGQKGRKINQGDIDDFIYKLDKYSQKKFGIMDVATFLKRLRKFHHDIM